ncbi:MAG: Unknown protein [uncultured Sulfurovum sp.]|uniref:Uncharacterized protein n=1 Tax=uncultured Sulfurovum sp. TaxID=269237 RepID=A0A6S6TIE0_9BACT|nr:MAG: Unknown protein [uncultured Sulfurovum sp.]
MCFILSYYLEVVTFGTAVVEGIDVAEERSSHINLTCFKEMAESEEEVLVLDEWYTDTLEKSTYRVPMVFSSNGREYQNQQKTKSGIWFRDLRRVENKARVLVHWFSPEEIAEFLDRNYENLVMPKKENSLNFESIKKIFSRG